MDIEGLIENLKTLSDILKSRPIRESASLNDFKDSYDRFEAVVSDLRVVAKRPLQQDPTNLRSILINLQDTISELDELCDEQLNFLDFVSAITPVTEIKD
jgi:ABC-type transporter Mla subunit MlaD